MERIPKHIGYSLGFLVLLVIAYQFSFKKTIGLKTRLSELKEQDDVFNSMTQNKVLVQQKLAHYDSILQEHKISVESSFQNNLLRSITEYSKSNDLKIINFKDPHLNTLSNGAIEQTYEFTVQSDFVTILKLIHQLEIKNKLGKITSVSYLKKKELRSRKQLLQCTVMLRVVIEN